MKQRLPHITPEMFRRLPDQTTYTLNQLIDRVNDDGTSTTQASAGGTIKVKLYNETGQNTDGAMTQKATTDALSEKVTRVAGKGLSTNDYTTAEKQKLEGVETGAQKNAPNTVTDANYVHTDNNYTTTDKNKLAGVETGAEKNVNADWNSTSGDSQIFNKPEIPSKVSQLENDSNFQTGSQVASSITSHNTNNAAHSDIRGKVSTIEGKIPSAATTSNQLADKDFVNSSINSVTAYYITKNAAGDQFNSKAELDSTTVFYSGGEVRVLTRNDYCIVLKDETKDDATTRYIYQNDNWEFQYTINETALTSDQLAALNSGITAAGVSKLNGIEAGAEVNVNADWNATSGDAQILNKPTALKNPNLLTVQKNGSTVVTYDGSAVKTANITVPTKTSELTNDSGFINNLDNYYTKTEADEAYRQMEFVNGKSTAITTSKDLNTEEFLTPGRYFCAKNAVAAECSNCPTTSAFSMTVETVNMNTETSPSDRYRFRTLTNIKGEQWTQKASQSSPTASWAYGSWSKVINTGVSKEITTAMLADGSVTSNKLDSSLLSELKTRQGYIGEDLTPAEDTLTGWYKILPQGESFVFYRTANLFTNQPTRYGILRSTRYTSMFIQEWNDPTTNKSFIRMAANGAWQSGDKSGAFIRNITGDSNNSITTSLIQDKAVTAAKLADNAVYAKINVPSIPDTPGVITGWSGSTFAEITQCINDGKPIVIERNDNQVMPCVSAYQSSDTSTIWMRIMVDYKENKFYELSLESDGTLKMSSVKKLVAVNQSNTVSTTMVADKAITTAKLGDKSATADKIDFSTFSTSSEAAKYMGGWHFEGEAYNTADQTSLKVQVTPGASAYHIEWGCETTAATWIDLRALDSSSNAIQASRCWAGIMKGSHSYGGKTSGAPIQALNVAASIFHTGVVDTMKRAGGAGNYRAFTGHVSSSETAITTGSNLNSNNESINYFQLIAGANMKASARLAVWSWSPPTGNA